MYTHGEIFVEICRFLVKLQAFCRLLTRQNGSAIFFTDTGTKPGARAEARFLHIMEIFVHFTGRLFYFFLLLQTPRRGLPLACKPGQAPFFFGKGGSFMKTKTSSTTRSIVLAALFLALAFVLPMVTGHVPQVGNMLCPMHFPILLCGFVLGGPWGLAVGFAAPLLRSVLFGMPPMFPIAISMAFELAAYGLVSGILWRKVEHTLPKMYAVLISAMVAGRLVWGAVRFVLAGLTGSSFPFSAFLSGALLTAVPGIIAQLILIPLILVALQKAKFID